MMLTVICFPLSNSFLELSSRRTDLQCELLQLPPGESLIGTLLTEQPSGVEAPIIES